MNIFDNKPIFIPKWNLKILISPGMMIDNKWSPGAQIDMSSWALNIELDQQCIATINNWESTVEISKHLVDDKVNHQHLLEFKLQGTGNIEHQMIHIRILVEDVDISAVLEHQGVYTLDNTEVKTGSEFMGEAGIQQLSFTTPIYKWLLDHKEIIVNNYHTSYKIK